MELLYSLLELVLKNLLNKSPSHTISLEWTDRIFFSKYIILIVSQRSMYTRLPSKTVMHTFLFIDIDMVVYCKGS